MNSVIGAYFRTTRVHIAALIYFLTAGILTQVPLFNYLGYEFSAVMTVPTALISGILTLMFFDEHRRKPLSKRTWLYIIGDYLHVNFLLLLIPLAVMSLNALVVKNCAFNKGLAFYMLLPVMTMVFSVSLAFVVGSLFRKKKTVFVLAILGILLHILYVTYTKQQLFAYNLVLGYFPGITYDETVGDMNTLVLFREFTILVSLLLILFFSIGLGYWDPKRSLRSNFSDLRKTFTTNRVLWSCIAIVLSVLVYGYLFRSDLGFEHASSDIQKELGRRSESDHFIFYYSGNDYAINDMTRLRAESEFHFRIVSARLQSGGTGRKIEVYIYPDGQSKRRFIGTSNTNIAKPWKREIHLTSATFDGSFRHELVHILAGEFGFPLIRASTRMGLNEGIAVAVDWETGLFTPHQYSAALLREKSLDNISSLFTLSGFATRSGTFAYTVTGSFCKYLIDRFGIDRVKIAFANGNFVFAFNENVEGLIRDWKAFLRTVDTSDLPRETIQAYFFNQAIFYKECAREVAEKNQQAATAVRVKDYRSAQIQFEASYSDAPSAFALRGVMHSLIAQQKFGEAIAKYEEVAQHSLLKVNPSLVYLYADALFLAGKTGEASHQYGKIIHMNFTESFIEAAVVRKLMIEEKTDVQMIHALYYSGSEDSLRSVVIGREMRSRPRSIVNLYVHGINEIRLGKMESALEAFRTIAADTRSRELKYFALVHSAEAEFQLGRYESAKMFYWDAKNYLLTPAINEYLDEKIELCDAVMLEE